MNNPWITTKTDVIYDNPWIQLTHNEVINPSGNPGIYGKVHFKNYAIAIVPLDENYNTWIVGQYRYTINQYSWEVPEGGGSLDLSPLESAQRELLEETGITAKNWQCVIEEMYLSNSVTDEKGMVFVAKDLRISSLSALIAAALSPLLTAWLMPDQAIYLGAVTVIAVLLIHRHKQNIIGLMKGKEGKIGDKAGS